MDLPSYTDPEGLLEYLLGVIILASAFFGLVFYMGWL